MRGQLSAKKAAPNIEKARFCAITVPNIVWIRNWNQNQKHVQSRNRNRNASLRFRTTNSSINPIPPWPEMEFLDINLTKYTSLLLHAIHSPFYWQILKKTKLYSGINNRYKKIREISKLESFHDGSILLNKKMRVENQEKTLVFSDSSLCPETSTEIAVQELHLRCCIVCFSSTTASSRTRWAMCGVPWTCCSSSGPISGSISSRASAFSPPWLSGAVGSILTLHSLLYSVAGKRGGAVPVYCEVW